MNSYPKGATVKLQATFKVSGTLTDPTTVTLKVRDPAGTITSYTYGGATVTKDSTGVYYKNMQLTTVGIWRYQYEGTGTAAGLEYKDLDINETGF